MADTIYDAGHKKNFLFSLSWQRNESNAKIVLTCLKLLESVVKDL